MCISTGFLCYCATLNMVLIRCGEQVPQPQDDHTTYRATEVIDMCPCCVERTELDCGRTWTSERLEHEWSVCLKYWLGLVYGTMPTVVPQDVTLNPEATTFHQIDADGCLLPEWNETTVSKAASGSSFAPLMLDQQAHVRPSITPESTLQVDNESGLEAEFVYDDDSPILSRHAALIQRSSKGKPIREFLCT